MEDKEVGYLFVEGCTYARCGCTCGDEERKLVGQQLGCKVRN